MNTTVPTTSKLFKTAASAGKILMLVFGFLLVFGNNAKAQSTPTQASGLSVSGITTTTVGTTTWTPGATGSTTGADVFVFKGVTSTPPPIPTGNIPNPHYVGNQGLFRDQIDLTEVPPLVAGVDTGWYCVEGPIPAGGAFPNGDFINGLEPNTTYTIMVAQFNFSGNTYNYNVSTSSGNLITFTTTANTLSSLVPSEGALNPSFAPGTNNYTLSLPVGSPPITFTPTVTDANSSTVTVNGTDPATPITLTPGLNVVTIAETDDQQFGVAPHPAPYGVNTYTVNIGVGNNDATLSALAISAGTLNPTFLSTTMGYSAGTVLNATSTLTVTPTTNDLHATVKVNGASASTPVNLNVGLNNINVVVTAQDGVTIDTYTISITRQSNVATLASLTLSAGSLSPPLNPGDGISNGTLNYTVNLPAGTTSITVTPTATDPNALGIFVNGTQVPTGTPFVVSGLTSGANPVNIKVTSQDGSVNDFYAITVNVQSNVATLATFATSADPLTPAFTVGDGVSNGTVNYAVTVPAATPSITITPTATNSNASIFVNGTAVTVGSPTVTVGLNPGANTITTKVTSQDGTVIDFFVLTVNELSNNSLLSGLTTSPSTTLIPTFVPATMTYSANLPYGTPSITVTPTTTDGTGTYTVTTTAGTSLSTNIGVASASISLVTGDNFITILVTSQDGHSTNSYSLDEIVAQPSAINTLSNLLLSNTTTTANIPFNEGLFSQAITAYTTTVLYNVTSVTVAPTTTNVNATVTVNGAPPSTPVAVSFATNPNLIPIVVTAQNGSQMSYSIAVNVPQVSTDATLSNLVSSAGAFNENGGVFSPAITTYSQNVSNATTSVTLTPTVNSQFATVLVNGVSATNPVALVVGVNSIPVTVTAQDGTTTLTYTINVTRAGSSVNTLSAMVLSSGPLSPVFASATNSYTQSVANGISTVTVTPVVTDPTATVTVAINGGTANTVASGSASSALSLTNTGGTVNTITVVVTAQNLSTNTYTILVTRGVSSNATLTALTINGTNTLLQSGTNNTSGFASGVSTYYASLANGTATVTLAPTAATGATVVEKATINGTTNTVSPTGSAITNSTNKLIVVTFTVTAADGTTTSTYTVNVGFNATESQSSLTALTVTGVTLNPTTFNGTGTDIYTASVPSATASVTVNVTLSSSSATVTVNGGSNLTLNGSHQGSASVTLNATGVTNIPIVVTHSSDGAVTTYTVSITRLTSTSSTLSNLVLSSGTLSPGFTSGNITYTSNALLSASPVTVTPTTTDGTGSISVKLNGTTVGSPFNSGVASPAITLSAGTNTIATIVTPQSGTATTYTTTVTAQSNVATLSNAAPVGLVSSGGAISPAFASGTTAYTETVTGAVPSITVTPTVTAGSNATVQVNGTTVTSGTASGAITLVPGANVITVAVTSQDGSVLKVYTLTVTQQSNVASLANLTLTSPATTLSPSFSGTTTSYTANVSSATTSITVNPTSNLGGTIKVNGNTVVSGAGFAVTPLANGANAVSIVVTSSDGTQNKTYTVTVNRAETLSYSPSSVTVFTGVAASITAPTASGGGTTGSPTSYSGSLPAGLILNTVTGAITGTATTVAVNTPFVITANYAGGLTANATLNITVTAPTLSYTGSPFTYFVGTAIANLNASSNTVAAPGGYTVNPALPGGLTLNPATGQITGNPTTPATVNTYTVTATYLNSVTATANITITVQPTATLSYSGTSPYTFYQTNAIANLTPVLNDGAPTNYSISPNSFPNTINNLTGLNFSTSTGIISGTPGKTSAATAYTITANYPGGVTATAVINITTLAAPTVSYTGTPFTYFIGVAVSPVTPNINDPVTGGFTISPSLSAGLAIDPVAGTLSGTPTATQASTPYTVTATYSLGVIKTAPVTITVNNPSFSYSSTTFNFPVGSPVPTTQPTTVNGTPQSYSAVSLPAGLSLDPVSGAITGTPTVGDSGALYVIQANYLNGVTSTVNLTITITQPTLAYGTGTFSFIGGSNITATSPTQVSGTPLSYSGTLPAGLSLNTVNGQITGAPTVIAASTPYIITANYANSVTASATLNITVTQPTIAYSASSYTFPATVAVASFSPTQVSGAPTSFTGTLPAGMTLNAVTGAIAGTPTTQAASTPYTITANYAGSITAPVTLNITISAPLTVSTLQNLTIANITNGGSVTLDQPFASGTTFYTASASTNTTTITVTPTVTAGSSATVKVSLNGGTAVAVNSGSPSANLALPANGGVSAVTIIVTAQDGVTTTTYTLNVGSTNSTTTRDELSALTITPFSANGTNVLSPVFNGVTNDVYTYLTLFSVPSVTVTPSNSRGSTITVGLNGATGITVNSGTPSGTLTLATGINTITITVNSTSTYTIYVNHPAVSTDATLSALTTTPTTTFTPTFSPGTLTYSANVTNATSSITLTPTTNSGFGTVSVAGGTAISSGATSLPVSLSPGLNPTITVLVTAQDGSTQKTYNLNVTRQSNVATLSNLVFSSGLFNENSGVFSPAITTYTQTVGSGVTSTTVTPTVTDPTSTVKVNGVTVLAGQSSLPITLNPGNTVITTVVTSQDGTVTDTYTVTVTQTSSIGSLASLVTTPGTTFVPTFATATTAYTINVLNAVSQITVTPTSNAAGTIAVTANNNTLGVTSGQPSVPINLAVGSNTITVTVTSTDFNTVTPYTLTVIRGTPSNVATLATLTTTPTTAFTPGFTSGVMSYTGTVAATTAGITVTATTTDGTGTIAVNGGTPFASGGTSQNVPISIGSGNTVNVVVLAQDGVTTHTYTTTITRPAPSTTATLSNLTVTGNPTTLTPAFTSGTNNYAVTESSTNTTSITVTPTVTDPNSTIKVNGITVTSGVASGAITLTAYGVVPITVVVTAQDGVTTNTYTVLAGLPGTAGAVFGNLTISAGTLTPAFAGGTLAYTDNVSFATTSLTVTPTAGGFGGTFTVEVNGATPVALASGATSAAQSLNVGSNILSIASSFSAITGDQIAITRAPQPVITAPASIAAVATTTTGTASTPTSFNVSGTNIAGNVTVTAPSGFEVSATSGGTYASSFNITNAGTPTAPVTLAPTQAFVRLAAADAPNSYTGNIVVSSTEATSVNVNIPSSTVTVIPEVITFNPPAPVTYGAGNFSPIASSTNNSIPITYTITAGTAASIVANKVHLLGSGIVTITANQLGDGTHSAAASVSQSLTINQATLTITGAAAAGEPYDGSTIADVSGTLVGVVSPDVITLNPTATFASANAGVEAVTGFGISGANAASYILTQPTGVTATITQVGLTISGLSIQDKPYDGTATATLLGTPVLSSGVVNGETVTVDGSSATALFTSVNAGSNIPVTVSGYTLSSPNYSLTQPSLTGNITQVGLTISGLSIQDKPYDGTATATLLGTPVLSSGVVNGETVTIGGTPAALFTSVNAGSNIPVTVSGYTLSSPNYSLTQPALTGNITQIGLTISGLSIQDKPYDGTATATLLGTPVLSSGVVNGETVTVDGSSATALFTSVNAGSNIPVTVSGYTLSSPNYSLTQPTGLTGNITQIGLTISGLSIQDKPYDGTATATLVGTPVLSSGVVNGETVTIGGTPAALFTSVNAGSNIPVTVSGYTLSSPNYSLTQPSLTGNITQVGLTISGLSIQDKPYDGTATATLLGTPVLSSGVVNGETVTIGGTPAALFTSVNAGSNIPVTVSGYTLSSPNYSLTQPALTGNITQIGLTISGLSIQDKPYDGTATATLLGTPVLSSGVVNGETVTVDGSSATALFTSVNAGSNIPVTVSGYTLSSPNYSLTQPTGLTGNITQVGLTISGLSIQDKPYDGTATATLVGTPVLSSGVVNGETVTIGGTPAALFTSVNAGSNIPVTVSGYTLSSPNYSLTQPTGLTGNITQVGLTISGLSIQDKPYDGTATATLLGTPVLSSGVVNGETVTIGGTPAALFTSVNAGSNIPVTVSGYTLSSPNYSLTQPALTGNITQVGLTISGLSIQDKPYDGTATATLLGTPVLSSGVVNGETVTVDGSSATALFTSVNAGSNIPVTVSGYTLSSPNYSLTQPTGLTGNITQVGLTISGLSIQDKPYDGTATATLVGTPVLSSGVVNGETVTVDGSSATALFTSVNAGSNIPVTVSGYTLSSPNYSLTQPTGLTGNITQVGLTISGLSIQDKPYDGTATATLLGTPVLSSGVVNGETVTVDGSSATALFTSVNAGSNIPVTVSGYTLSSPNYSLTQPALTGNITQVGLTISGLSIQDKPYDGTATATLLGTPVLSSGVVNGETVTVDGSSATALFTSVNAGSNIPVTVSGYTLSSPNYSLTQPTGLTGNITQVGLTISGLSIQDKPYDGTATATLLGTPVLSSGVVNGETVTIGGTPAALFTSVNAGSNIPVTVSGYTLSSPNYSLTQPTGLTGNITQVGLTISGLSIQDKPYDGTATATLVGTPVLSSGVVNGETVTIGGTPAALFTSVNAGSNIPVTVSGYTLSSPNYSLTQPSLTGNITQIGLTISGLSIQDKPYDGTATATLVGTPVLSSGVVNGETVTIGGTPAALFTSVNAGSNIPVTVSGYTLSSPNYSLTQPTGLTGNITQVGLTISGLSIQDKPYDGTATATLVGTPVLSSGVVNGETVTIGGTPAALFTSVNAGSNIPVTVSGYTLSSPNYSLTQPTGLTGNITQVGLTISGLSIQDKPYDGTATATLVGTPVLSSGVVNGETVTIGGTPAALFTSVNAGSNIPVTVSGYTLSSPNYSLTQPSLTGNITQVGLTISGLSIQDKPYDGTATATLVGTPVLSSGVVNGETVTIGGTPAALFTSVNAGSNIPVTVSGYTLSSPNYSLTQPTGLTGNITQVGLTISGLSIQDKPYDGTATATLVGTPVLSSGVVNGETVTIGGTPAALFTSVNAGSNIPVTVSGYTLSSPNYSLTQPTGLTGNITQVGLTISGLSIQGKPYDGTATATLLGTPVLSSGVVNGETVTIGGTPAALFTSVNAGSNIPVTVSGYTLSSPNYSLTQPTGLTGNITQVGLTISGLSIQGKPYDGTATATLLGTPVLSSGVVNGETVTIGGTPTAVFTSVNAGSNIPVTVSGYTLSSPNYSLTQPSLTGNITQIALTVSGLTANSKPYDATTAATLSGTAALSGLLPADLLNVTLGGTPTAVFTSAAVGNNIPVTVTGYTISGPSAIDYAFTQPSGLSANIITVSDAALSNLVSSGGALTPTFTSGNFSYAQTVPFATTSISVTPTTHDSHATFVVQLNGTTVNPASIALVVGATNIITTKVTAQDGTTTQTYTLTVTRTGSNNAFLSHIAISAGTLTPAAGTNNYTISVPYATASTTLTATTGDPNATVKVALNGGAAVAITSGIPSGSLALNVGANIITTVVTAQDGHTTQTYTITATRAGSPNAFLSHIAISAGTLTPAAGTNNYTITVPNTTTSVTVTATTGDPNATEKVALNSGTAVAITSGIPSGSLALSVGANIITVVVTAQDGVTTQTYTITATRTGSSNANLAGLSVSGVTLAPVFATGTTSYAASVGNATTTVTVIPSVTDVTATVTVALNGGTAAAVTSGTASLPLALNVGANIITTKVTAQDGITTKTYTVTVTRAPSNVAYLSHLTLSSGTLSPAFANVTSSYTASVANAISAITVTPTTTDPTATVKVAVNGGTATAVTSGTASASLPLNVGTNTITTVVTAQDGITTITYTVVVTRPKSSVANLAGLTISSGTLAPVFATGTTSYTANVATTITSVTVTPTTTDPTATVKVGVNGGTAATVTSGTASGSLALNIGANTITTTVTAQDGVTTKTYTIIVTRAKSNNAFLSHIAASAPLTPAAGTNNYTASVSFATTSFTVTPTTSDPNATVKVNGTPVTSGTASTGISLAIGANIVTTIVTAQDGITTQTYTITVTRAKSNNASLTQIGLSAGTLTPVAGTNNYIITVGPGTASTTEMAITSDPNATMTVSLNGGTATTLTSGTASGILALNTGANTITTVVTAQDGITTKTYIITITRLSNNAFLSHIAASAPLTPVTGTNNYTASVSNAVLTFTVTPTTSDPNATVKVNGTSVVSGTASAAINLNVGSNTVTTIVTAQDGVTTKTYIITVTRATGPLKTLHQPIQPEISVTKPTDTVAIENDGVMVHQGVSPNGDGINDFLTIDGISAYPNNRFTIIDRNGSLVYEVKGYDNTSRMFDGHSNINGKLQQPGTYFYSLDYIVNGQTKHKTGFIILKY